MQKLAKPSEDLTYKPASASLAEISPDDLIIVQKRQDWRVRMAHVCLDYFEAADPDALASDRRSAAEIRTLAEKLSRISDHVRRDMPVLLVTGVTVNELEAVRYQVNYFLEEIVRHLRQNIQSRSRSKTPLEGIGEEGIREEVWKALPETSDSLVVFIEDVVRLVEFELEVTAQRERIRLLLGGDRRLSTLGNNETIMSAGITHLWRMIDDFLGVSNYLRENLPPLLEKRSPYPALEDELEVADEQLQLLVRDREVPFEERLEFKKAQDRVLRKVEDSLTACLAAVKQVLEVRIVPLQRQVKLGRPPIAAKELNHLHEAVVDLGERLVALPSVVFLPEPEKPMSARGESRGNDLSELNASLEEVLAQMLRLRRTALYERGESSEVPEGEALKKLLREIQERVRATRTAIDQAVAETQVLRGEKLRTLREHFCSMMGEFRTFLQTSFAHIASKDPRSTESSYHFFLREFSDEAHQALLLMREIRDLETLIQSLQSFNVAGLPLTPENLARILRVIFIDKAEEKKRIPSGEGWKVMATFLEKLKNELVPRLQKVCAMDGIRFEDKNFLSDWAMELSQNCSLCVAQHEIGYSLTKEMGRLRDDSDVTRSRETYTHIVTAKTCKAMQESLTEICMTLTASIPYVGIMRGGIERRASVFFHRQQKILGSQSEEPEKTSE